MGTRLMVIGVATLALAGCASIPTLHEANDAVRALQDYDRWAWAVGLALICADVVLPIPQSAVIAALGMIYGTLTGTLLGSLGMISAGLIGYGLMLTAARRLVHRLAGTESLRRMERLFDRGGAWAIALTRSLPYSFSEIMVFLAGLAGMPLAKFTVALILGSIPTAFIFAAIGAGWVEQPLLALAASYAIPFVLLPIALYLMQRRA